MCVAPPATRCLLPLCPQTSTPQWPEPLPDQLVSLSQEGIEGLAGPLPLGSHCRHREGRHALGAMHTAVGEVSPGCCRHTASRGQHALLATSVSRLSHVLRLQNFRSNAIYHRHFLKATQAGTLCGSAPPQPDPAWKPCGTASQSGQCTLRHTGCQSQKDPGGAEAQGPLPPADQAPGQTPEPSSKTAPKSVSHMGPSPRRPPGEVPVPYHDVAGQMMSSSLKTRVWHPPKLNVR